LFSSPNVAWQTVKLSKQVLKQSSILAKNVSDKLSRNFIGQEGKLDFDQSISQDPGFKVFKLDRTIFKQWRKPDPSASSEQIVEQLELHIDNIDHKATPEDLLYEILLKTGFIPTGKIETQVIASTKVFSVADGVLLLCLEDNVAKELIDNIAEIEPMQFICLDPAFHSNDQLKANALQTFATRNMHKEKHNQTIFKTI
jgi:adenine-specific DNA-methyltransferase